MSACHSDHDHGHGEAAFDGASTAYRSALWLVIAINAAMFFVEIGSGTIAESKALHADALDFAADSVTYAMSLVVIGMPLAWRARAALLKSASLALMAAWVIATTVPRAVAGAAPDETIMGTIGILALCANVASALVLLRFRDGDSNVRSVWLCSRNDALGNVAVVVAAGAVAITGSRWPDLVVAAAMAALFLSSSVGIARRALKEIRHGAAPARAARS